MRVLFTTPPGWGHVHPMVPLAKAFVDRGDEVAWAAAEEVVPRLERDGFDVLPAGISDTEGWTQFAERFPEILELPPPQRPDVMFSAIFGAVRARPMLADLLPLAGEWCPSLVVRDAAEFAGPIVAAKLGIPSVTHAFGSQLPRQRVAAVDRFVAPLWEAHGLSPRPYGGSYDHLYLDIYPESMRVEDVAHVGQIQPLRPVTFAATAGDLDVPDLVTKASPLPLVYVTFGTVFNADASLVATVVGALAQLDIRVVATVGPNGDPASLGDQPDNVAVARYIPQTELLPRCAAVVSHAGSGTFLATLALGLPQLCLPQGADQFLNAAACGASGAGVVLVPGTVNAESVQGAMKQLLGEPPFRAAAARLAAEIAAMPSPEEVAALLATRFAPA